MKHISATPWAAPRQRNNNNFNLNSKEEARRLRVVSRYDILINVLSGCGGGVVNVVVGQPLDTAKTKLQIYPKYYTGTWHCLKETWHTEGGRGIYSGLTPNLAVVLLESVVLFFLYPSLQTKLADHLGISVEELKPWQKGMAGSLASVASASAMTPAEVIKCRLQVIRETLLIKKGCNVRDPNPPLVRYAWEVIEKEGFRSLGRGLGPAISRDIIGGFFYFSTYEWVLKMLNPANVRREDVKRSHIFVAGGASGIAMWLTSFPFDVVRARIQTTRKKLTKDTPTPTGFGMARQICAVEGFWTLWSGITPILIRTIPGCGLFFVVYEGIRANLRSIFLPEEQFQPATSLVNSSEAPTKDSLRKDDSNSEPDPRTDKRRTP